uniref:Palmitoyltransferase n=1 Tax=Theileria annulata TaxID=5874 RepID=A0A3B0MXQ9_THEAN
MSKPICKNDKSKDSKSCNVVLDKLKSFFANGDITTNKCFVRTATFTLLCIPHGIFWATQIPWFVKFNPYGFLVPIFFGILFIISLIFFFICSFINPGIIPKQNSNRDCYDLFTGFNTGNYRNKYSFRADKPLFLMINGRYLRVKYCETCNIYRPPRSVHCRLCDVCVNRFDHHCKWVGNCIGYNNYRQFIAFIFTTFILIITMICLSIVRAVYITRGQNMLRLIIETTTILVYIVFFGWFIAGLAVYHSYLAFTNQTTNEQLKGVLKTFNPWNRGFLLNIREILFVKRKKLSYESINSASKFMFQSANANFNNKNGVKIRKIYNPVSGFENPGSLNLIKDYLFDKRYVINSIESSNYSSLDNSVSWDHNYSFKELNSNEYKLDVPGNLGGCSGEPISGLDGLKGSTYSGESQSSESLGSSFKTLEETYNFLKNDLVNNKIGKISDDEIQSDRKNLKRKNGMDLAISSHH